MEYMESNLKERDGSQRRPGSFSVVANNFSF